MAQPTQLVDADAPVVVIYKPTAHEVQLDEPVPNAYWPVVHPMQLVDANAPVVAK